MKLYFFDTGTLRCDKSSVTLGRGAGTIIDMPVPFFLIRHPEGNLLYDTGNAREVAENPESYWGISAKTFQPTMAAEQYCVDQLLKLGLKPEDINFIVVSHLHMDHAGGLRDFPNAKILVQRKEMEWAYTADFYQKIAYIREDFDYPYLKYQYIEGLEQNPYDIFGDGSVTVWFTPGHTPGHQALLVKLPKSGSFLLTGDVCHISEILNKDILPTVCWSTHETVKSIKMLRHMRDTGITVVTGHDPKEWKQYKKAPEYYE